MPPGPARGGPGVEDDEVQALAAQVVAGGEPRLAAADHHHVGVLCHATPATPAPCTSGAARTSRAARTSHAAAVPVMRPTVRVHQWPLPSVAGADGVNFLRQARDT
ncbi:hypothetical protein SLIV_19805 [Streptomyces lividans TK24]|uniref:Uncharacterized protein n=1 Tax=Streptomyces lividans TK24 TaxID=457428 RepID=A0ABN4DWV6_STRLI|nr:hypothetical protein SLIV_19805 [Streptomyces lividans TK24]QSJ10467.1 hypothetical protein SLIVDG2_19805 [Streptomyces lividans]QTD71377.1 hypothetical protein SLIVYQS_19805 [Streptomyces lividans TK24] [Streptomyces lividans]